MRFSKKTKLAPFQTIRPVCAGCHWPIKLFTLVIVWPDVPADAEQVADGGHFFRCPVLLAARSGALPAWEEENGSAIVWQLAEGIELLKKGEA